jgi:hypothetical protein
LFHLRCGCRGDWRFCISLTRPQHACFPAGVHCLSAVVSLLKCVLSFSKRVLPPTVEMQQDCEGRFFDDRTVSTLKYLVPMKNTSWRSFCQNLLMAPRSFWKCGKSLRFGKNNEALQFSAPAATIISTTRKHVRGPHLGFRS